MSPRRRAARAAAGANDPGLFGAEPPPPAEPPAARLAPELSTGESPDTALSVGTLNHLTKDILEGAVLPLWVHGEVSDFKSHRNGAWYFTLRDADAQIRCVMWSTFQRRHRTTPDDGMHVVALGQLTVYPSRGDLQLSVMRLGAVGDGLWQKAFEAARATLLADGLLDPARKRPIPRHPRRIAIITSRDGAALHDIIAVVKRRSPATELVVIAAAVQGDGAPESLCGALARVARWGEADTLIIGRGGGSREDLWAFNDEQVARAVARCPMPVISAVGHEVDITLCDLVADLRAPTPSAAAEAAVPVWRDVVSRVKEIEVALGRLAEQNVLRAREQAGARARALVTSAGRVIDRRRLVLRAASGRLEALSPLATLRRGYTVARTPEGRTLLDAAGVLPDQAFDLLFHDGTVRALALGTSDRRPASLETHGEKEEDPA